MNAALQHANTDNAPMQLFTMMCCLKVFCVFWRMKVFGTLKWVMDSNKNNDPEVSFKLILQSIEVIVEIQQHLLHHQLLTADQIRIWIIITIITLQHHHHLNNNNWSWHLKAQQLSSNFVSAYSISAVDRQQRRTSCQEVRDSWVWCIVMPKWACWRAMICLFN